MTDAAAPLEITSRCTVLVVEGDRAAAFGLESLLESEGFQVAVASTPRQALAAFLAIAPDAVLAGGGMERPEGLLALAAMRQAAPSAPIARIAALADAGHAPGPWLQSMDACQSEPGRAVLDELRATLSATAGGRGGELALTAA